MSSFILYSTVSRHIYEGKGIKNVNCYFFLYVQTLSYCKKKWKSCVRSANMTDWKFRLCLHLSTQKEQFSNNVFSRCIFLKECTKKSLRTPHRIWNLKPHTDWIINEECVKRRPWYNKTHLSTKTSSKLSAV